MTYAWIIDEDVLFETGDPLDFNEAGIEGPWDAPPWMLAALKNEGPIKLTGYQIHSFEMFDDDGILYYTGRIIADNMDYATQFKPLDDFGQPNAGAVSIQYPEHPEWGSTS